jgi:hypothetical protein
MIRKGSAANVMVFPDSDYDNSAFRVSNTSGQYLFFHRALGADMFRYSLDFGMNWTNWTKWEDISVIDAQAFNTDENWWEGQHIVVQCAFSMPKYLLYVLSELPIKIGVMPRYLLQPSYMPTEAMA